MKHRLFRTMLLVAASVALMVSCSPKQDLKHIEPGAEVKMGLAIPVGDINVKLGDFLGMGNVGNFLQIRNDSVIEFKDTFVLHREFHSIDISNYVSNMANKKLNIYDQTPAPIKALGYVDGDGVTAFEFTFPFDIDFEGINSNVEEERLDSMVVKSAEFTSVFNLENLNLSWNEIKSLDIILDENAFHRAEGRTIHLPIEGKNFGQEIPIVIDEFTLNLMEDVNKTPGYGNALKKAKVTISMNIVPDAGNRIYINNNSQFSYDLKVKFIDYHALFGYFRASKFMADEDTIVLGDQWEGWKNLISLEMPLAEPEIYLQARHYLGVPLTLYGRYLWVKNDLNDAEAKYATFNRAGDKKDVQINLPGVPKNAPYDTEAVGEFTFDNREEHGHLDKLFAIHPNYLAYKFDIVPDYSDPQLNNQARITKNTAIELNAVTTVPLIFNEGVDLTFTDTLTDIHIDQISLDSLLEKAEFIDTMKTANLKLVLLIKNTIPFNLGAHLTFIDYKNDSIPLHITSDNWIRIAGPGVGNLDGSGDVKTPVESALTLDLDKENMEMLSKVKALKLQAHLGDNTAKARLKSSNSLNIHLGIGVDVQAVLDMNKLLDSAKDEAKNLNEQ